MRALVWMGIMLASLPPVGSASAQQTLLQLSSREWQALDDSLAANPYYLAMLPRDSAVALIQAAMLTRDEVGLRWAAFGPGVCIAMERPRAMLQEAELRAVHRESYECLSSLSSVLTSISTGTATDSETVQVGAMLLEEMAEAAVEIGRLDEADSLAALLLIEYVEWGGWMEGNLLHNANQVRGRVALRRGDVSRAREYLAAAGDTPGSPQLNSFGPQFMLARELLQRDEPDAVLAYLSAVRRFWTHPEATRALDEAEALIRAGQIPTGIRWR